MITGLTADTQHGFVIAAADSTIACINISSGNIEWSLDQGCQVYREGVHGNITGSEHPDQHEWQRQDSRQYYG